MIKQRIAASGSGEVGRLSYADYISREHASLLRLRIREERKGEYRDGRIGPLKKLASELLAYDDQAISRAVASGTLTEVTCDEKAIP